MPILKNWYFSSGLETSSLCCLQTVCNHYSRACSSWTWAGSCPVNQLNTSYTSPTRFFPFKQFSECTFQRGRKGPRTVSVHLVDQKFEQLILCNMWADVRRKKIFKPPKPLGREGKVPCESWSFIPQGTWHHIWSTFYKGIFKTVWLHGYWGTSRATKPRLAVKVVVSQHHQQQ